MKRRFKITIIIMVILIITFFVIAISMTKNHTNRNYFMYSNIASLDVLSQYIIEDIKEDNFLHEIIPLKKFAYKVNWNNKKFDVYAYIFVDNRQCMQYITNRTQMHFDDNASFYLSSNVFFKTKYIVYSDNKLLYIEGPNIKSTYEFLDYIEQNFDIKIE